MQEGGTTRVFLVDDHELFRNGLRVLLSALPEFEVVGEAGEAREARAIVRKVHPDLVVADVMLPGLSGLAFARELRIKIPACKVLMLSTYATHDYIERAFATGALGYALKNQPADETLEAIRTVARGEVYVPPSLAEAYTQSPPRQRLFAEGGLLARLSSREREVFDLVIQGMSNENVAQALFISIKTVETHRAHINKKLHAHSTSDLIRIAVTAGLALK